MVYGKVNTVSREIQAEEMRGATAAQCEKKVMIANLRTFQTERDPRNLLKMVQ